jgi:hypothetical protein
VLFLNYCPFNSPFSLSLVVRARDVRLSRSVVLYKPLALVSRVSISSGSEREGIVRHAVVGSILRRRIGCLQIGYSPTRTHRGVFVHRHKVLPELKRGKKRASG